MMHPLNLTLAQITIVVCCCCCLKESSECCFVGLECSLDSHTIDPLIHLLSTMPAVDNLFNPFRADKKAQEEAGRVKQSDPFGAFNFAIQPPEFPCASSSPPRAAFNKGDNSPQAERENDPQNPEFDPFQIASPQGPKETNTISRKVAENPKPTAALAPKLVVKLSTHEEVTSRLKMALDDFDVTSELSVEGTVYAQVHCSDARKNAPFALLVPRVAGGDQCFTVRPNENYAVSRNAATRNVPILVTIPKQDIVAVPIAYYSLQKELKFMPVLLERKITRNGSRVRIAIQVRSRLDNAGDMEDITILVAVPEKVNGNTVTVSRGSGVWDDLKRTIKWKLPALYKGDSALVVAEADLWKRPATNEDETPFPVLFRCSSVCDPITPLEWKLAQVSGSPAHITVSSIQHSFRLLHRLP